MRDEILKLEKAVLKLDLKEKRRASFNASIVNYLNEFIDNLSKSKGFENDFSSSNEIFSTPFNDNGYPIDEILQLFNRAVNSNGIQPASGAHIGYIPGGGIPAAAYGDFIAAMTNKYSGIYYANPGAVNIENHLLNWFAEIFGFNKDSYGGNLTTGGSIANLIAIVAARDKYNIKGKDYHKTVIYGSEQMHHCLHKAIRISGLSECIYREIPLESSFHININELKKQLEIDAQMGLNPFLIIGSAGTTDTGVIDDLDSLRNLANKFNCWFHVDAAYGGFFYMLDEYKEKFIGIDQADSLVIDPHKGMFLPYGSGAILVKEKEDLLRTNYYLANYMKDAYAGHEHLSPADLSPELSRNFRGLRLWLPLLFHGKQIFKDALREKLLLTNYIYKAFEKLNYIELGPSPELTVFTFRFISIKEEQSCFNQKLLDAIHKDGRIFISSTTIDNELWLRVAILSFRTHLKEIDLLIEMVEKHFTNAINS